MTSDLHDCYAPRQGWSLELWEWQLIQQKPTGILIREWPTLKPKVLLKYLKHNHDFFRWKRKCIYNPPNESHSVQANVKHGFHDGIQCSAQMEKY